MKPHTVSRQENQVSSLDNYTVANNLLDMRSNVDQGIQIDSQELWLMQEQILLLSTTNLHRGLYSNTLGNICLKQWEQYHIIDDLNQAVCAYDDAVQDQPMDGGYQDTLGQTLLNNLGISLRVRFQQLGDFEDLTKSVSLAEYALYLTPERHTKRPGMLNSLSNSLMIRFKYCGDPEDLAKSVSMIEEAISLTPDRHPDKPQRLSNLSTSLLARFEQLGVLDDINKSVSFQEDAIRLTPEGHTFKPSMLNSLGVSLCCRFRQLGNLTDLNKSVSNHLDAVQMTPDGHSEKPLWLHNLSNALFIRFKQVGDLQDLNKSVSVQEDALRLTLHGGPAMPLRLSGPADMRFSAAVAWANTARVGPDSSLLDAYNMALNILPELAWLGLSISDRHYQIMKAGSVVRDAAATAIAAGQPEKAVEWLEQGRSIIWGQLLNLRTPVDVLKQKHPEVAQKLMYLSMQLEGAVTQGSDPNIPDSGPQKSLNTIAHNAHENAHERARLLKQIRELEGFEHFFLPKTILELSPAAREGPVIVLNLSQICCDALILLPSLHDKVMHVPLTAFTLAGAENLSTSVQNLVPSSGRNERLFGKQESLLPEQEGSLLPEHEFAKILSELWVRLVKPVLDALGIATPIRDHPQRIWWCPTGPLTLLPLHAAGLYGTDDIFGSKLSDFVVSSYTPSLTALVEGFRPLPKLEEGLQLLAVAQPSAAGQTYIPGTQEEPDHIQLLARDKLSVLRLEKDKATVESVQTGMKDSSWVHFACHGIQKTLDPTQSALLLAGSEQLTLSNIINLSLPHANFAFLSACQTATGVKKLQEESVHLAAGMLSAGYRGVIATMWTIMDNDAPQVASDVYEHLLETSPPDSTRAAEALHLAIRNLCETSGGKKTFFHWVPYIHVGV
ncbi:CHAT domain-containing protein [Mycena epipterygia]|nr:CHAT domain-containing protein [Mycena epipterygia]